MGGVLRALRAIDLVDIPPGRPLLKPSAPWNAFPYSMSNRFLIRAYKRACSELSLPLHCSMWSANAIDLLPGKIITTTTTYIWKSGAAARSSLNSRCESCPSRGSSPVGCCTRRVSYLAGVSRRCRCQRCDHRGREWAWPKNSPWSKPRGSPWQRWSCHCGFCGSLN